MRLSGTWREGVSLIQRAAALPTEAIAPAIRLAAALMEKPHLSEQQAAQAANVQARVWDRIRPDLAGLFTFSRGMVSMPDYEDLDGFDLLALRTAAKDKTKRPMKPPTDPRVIDLIGLGMEQKAAGDLVRFAVRTYGSDHFTAALGIAKDRQPDEPRGFILKVIQNRIGATAGTADPMTVGGQAKKVLKSVRVQSPEAARATLLGWEAPTLDALGIASYPKGHRRQVWRDRTGVAKYSDPPAGANIPTPLQDPGVILVESLR